MNIDINKLVKELRELQNRKMDLKKEYESEIQEIEEKIKAKKAVIDKIKEILEPHLCKCCSGTGEESYTDAAGSRDYKECSVCHGQVIL